MITKHYILTLLALFASINAFADDAIINNIAYNFHGNTAIVTYRTNSSGSRLRYSGLTGAVSIPSTVTYEGETYRVTGIDDYTFESCPMTSIRIPNSVTTIGNHAFSSCTNLTYVTIPDGVISIGPSAFLGCTSLKTMTLGNNIETIGASAFSGCTNLYKLEIKSKVSSIGKYALPTHSSAAVTLAVYCYTKIPPIVDEYLYRPKDSFNSYSQSFKLHVPYGYLEDYMADPIWSYSFKYSSTYQIYEDLAQTTITVDNSGYATFCSPKAMDFSDITGIKAYIASRFNPSTGKLVLTRVTEVPAGEGLYIKGTPGEYVIPETTTSMFYSNLLKGVTATINISPTDGDKTNFILANGIHGIAFYTLSGEGNLRTSKAYLQIPTAQVPEVKALKIIFEDEDDDPTGIAITSAISQEEETIYNLAGQRVSKAQKGINIINGKKVVIK